MAKKFKTSAGEATCPSHFIWGSERSICSVYCNPLALTLCLASKVGLSAVLEEKWKFVTVVFDKTQYPSGEVGRVRTPPAPPGLAKSGRPLHNALVFIREVIQDEETAYVYGRGRIALGDASEMMGFPRPQVEDGDGDDWELLAVVEISEAARQ